MKLKSSLLIALLFLAACGKPAGSETVASNSEGSETSKVGPFVVEFQGDQQTYEHTMSGAPSVDQAQTEGKVEYFITTNENSKITFVKTELKVEGCSASQVTHQTFWLPDASKEEGQLALPGMAFQSQAKVRGLLLHVIRGLQGCTKIDLYTSLKRTKIEPPNSSFPVGQACQGSGAGTDCKVQVYCREHNPLSNYVEVEIWKQSWGLQLQKFMRRSDGSRGQMVSETTALTSGTGYQSYRGGSTNLYFSTVTGVGSLTESYAGSTYKTDLDCASAAQ